MATGTSSRSLILRKSLFYSFWAKQTNREFFRHEDLTKMTVKKQPQQTLKVSASLSSPSNADGNIIYVIGHTPTGSLRNSAKPTNVHMVNQALIKRMHSTSGKTYSQAF